MKRIAALILAWLVCTSVVISSEPTADDYLKFFEPLLGEWAMTAKIGDTVGEGTFSCRLARTGNCLLWYGSAIAPYPASQSLDGYDPVLKKWKGCSFSADGRHQVITYLPTDAEALKSNRAEFKCEATESKATGEVVTWEWKATFVFGDNEWKLFIKDQIKNGEKTPDEEIVYKRKTKK